MKIMDINISLEYINLYRINDVPEFSRNFLVIKAKTSSFVKNLGRRKKIFDSEILIFL